MPYSMEVLIEETQTCDAGHQHRVKVWRKVRPTGGAPYIYETRAEAERMLRMCYPLKLEDEARVIEV